MDDHVNDDPIQLEIVVSSRASEHVINDSTLLQT